MNKLLFFLHIDGGRMIMLLGEKIMVDDAVGDYLSLGQVIIMAFII